MISMTKSATKSCSRQGLNDFNDKVLFLEQGLNDWFRLIF